MDKVCSRVSEGNIDVLGIAETKLDTTMPCVLNTCHRRVRQSFAHSKLLMSSSTRSYGSTHKPGGTMLLTRGNTTVESMTWADGVEIHINAAMTGN
jgi:hypothetical protein